MAPRMRFEPIKCQVLVVFPMIQPNVWHENHQALIPISFSINQEILRTSLPNSVCVQDYPMNENHWDLYLQYLDRF